MPMVQMNVSGLGWRTGVHPIMILLPVPNWPVYQWEVPSTCFRAFHNFPNLTEMCCWHKILNKHIYKIQWWGETLFNWVDVRNILYCKYIVMEFFLNTYSFWMQDFYLYRVFLHFTSYHYIMLRHSYEHAQQLNIRIIYASSVKCH